MAADQPPRAAPPGGRPAAAGAAPDAQVPRLLRQGAAWSWRLLLVAVVIYLAYRAVTHLRLVTLPLIGALLVTALLQPLTARLRRAGLHPLAATWGTVLVTFAAVAVLGLVAAGRVSADYPRLVTEARHTAADVQRYLAGPPFHISNARLQVLVGRLGSYLAAHKSVVAGTVLTGGRIFAEFAAGLILMLFITFFLLKDGDRIWAWLISGLPEGARARAGRAGGAAWQALVNYVRGTATVAAIHAVFIGLALWLLGVPLLIPLVIAVFLAAFVPLIGLLAAGALAILVTLVAKGWLIAVILLCILVAEDQLEAHLLQPQVVGRVIRLHPLAVILSLAAGAELAGIPGAVVAVPVVAVITRALPELRRSDPDDLVPEDP